MRKLFILLFLISILIIPVKGQGLEAPTAPSEASPYMPYEIESFGEGLAYIFSQAIKSLMPDISEGIKSALLLLSCGLATVYLSNLHGGIKTAADMVAVLFSGTVLLNGTRSLISLGIDTIRQMDSYSKLLLPV